jgi:APA family basic amino acid/polyamine antiporter
MPRLKKDLTLYALTMIAIGSCIGSGIFRTPTEIAGHLGTSGWILAAWALGGLIALTGALTFAELGAMFPRAGGVYAYLREAYGPFAGFLYGWAYFTVINSGALAALSLTFTDYLATLIPPIRPHETVVAVAAIVVITLINVFRVKVAAFFTNTFTGLKLLGIGAIVVVGLVWGSGGAFAPGAEAGPPPESGLLTAFGLALVGVFWSYGGWQHASYLSGEARNARVTVPRAMVLGAAVVTATYLLTNAAYLALLPVDAIAGSSAPAADAVGTVIPIGGRLVAVLIAVSTFGTALIYMMSAPRIYFAMARDGLFFRKIAEVHPRYHAPVNAVLLQSGWAIVLLLFWGTFESVITYVTFTDWIFFTAAACAVILFRFTRKDAERPYRVFGYPVTPLVFIVPSLAFVVNTLIEKPAQAGAGLALLAAGLPVYLAFRRRGARS